MRFTLVAALLSLLTATTLLADDCDDFKWNLAQENALYAGAPIHVQAATDVKTAPAVSADTLIEVALAPQASIHYALAPGKKTQTDGAVGGLLSFIVPTSGDYRIGLDAPFWIDVIANDAPVTSKDFGSRHGCAKPPHKLVIFELKAGTHYLMQLSGPAQPNLHVTLVKADTARP